MVGHDVFMSFRGEDTRAGFTSHLYDALIKKGISTYKDDKSLEIGNLISPELLKAIEISRFAIVVLSTNFATSKWCLEEIAKVVDCMEQGKLIVIPVFYHVSPSDVRHQRNCFEQSFASYEADPEITPHKVASWRSAFAKVGAMSGHHVQPHTIEAEVVSEIIRKIWKDMQDMLPTNGTNRLVGIESRVDEVNRILSMESSEVRFIGICGMSGIGKTTLAKVVYDGIRKGTRMDEFQGRSFIGNIKDVSKENDTELYKLQQKLLVDIFKEESIRVGSVGEGQTLLETKLRRLKVFIVLDDVNTLNQLTYLAGEREWFGPGTRIIVTTTNKDLLIRHKIKEIYTCEELEGDDALRLFCQSAFEEGHPTHGYEKFFNDIVKLACGLPLALSVYASLLYGKEESYWEEMLKKLREYPPEEVRRRLQIVYDKLDRDQQNTFIYIACFLKGRNKDLINDILTNIGLYAGCGVADLINRFLITINYDESVWMHDMLQQMCWEVVRAKKLIAIKYRKDLLDVLSSTSEETRIEIINQEPYKVEGNVCIDDPACFSKMRKLKFLRISNIDFRQGLNFLSNDLRILEWDGCSLKSLPSTFEPTHIYELEMCSSQLETLWEKDIDLSNLRSINLSFSKNLTKIPDLTSAVNLVKLNLEGCTKLTKLHESILLQKKLRYMNLKGCTLLTSLGRSTMEMEALEALLLSGCSNLEYIPELGHNMKRLEHLYVDGTRIKKLPDNLGEMCDLRVLDASETCIEELPSFLRRLKRLRLLRVHGCRLLSKTGGFLYSNLGILSPGLRELDLSYCNLSVVPEDIGLLYHVLNLDLSGNDFVSLPASLSLLSKLRMLCLNNCKRLQSLPKLSRVNEDTLLGVQIRFNYYISGEGVDVSKVHATSNNSNPTISCLNCPKLAENESGSYLAEKILNCYLQLRTNYCITPEAVFEIVGAGSEIPSGFKLVGSDDSILNVLWIGPWIGVAICAVLAVDHVDAYMETKYMVTTHIHVGEKHWKIPVPINFLVAGLENQLVFYWTADADLQRIVGSSQPHNFRFSFSMEPKDGNLRVTKFGVRFMRNEDMLQLKLHEYSTSLRVHTLFRVALSHPTDLQCSLRACEADTDLHLCASFIHDLTSRIIKFILDYGKQQDSLDGIHKIIRDLLEVNQEVLSECMGEWRHAQLFPLVYDYYWISHGTSELYNDFVRLLKDISDSWLSAKLALEQIVVKSRADDYTYEEMLQQLNDLEAAKSVRFSDDFVTSFAHICKQMVTFSTHLGGVIQGNKKFKSVKVLAKVSCITLAGILSMVATYVGGSELLQEMKDIMSNSMWLQMIETFTWKVGEWFNEKGPQMKTSYDRELQIWDFNDNAILLQDLKNKMTRSKENEVGMMVVIDKLGKKIDIFSKTIEDMSGLAHEYSHVTREAGITLDRFIADGKLQVTRFGVCFRADEDILLKRLEDPMREAVSNLFRATAFLPAALHWYICPCETDRKILYRQTFIRTHASIKSLVNIILEHTDQDPFYGILEILRWLNGRVIGGILLESYSVEALKDRWVHPLVHKQLEIGKRIRLLWADLLSLLGGISQRWECVALVLEQILEKTRVGDYTYGEMLQQLNDVEAAESAGFSDDFVTSFEYICDETAALFRSMNLVIFCNKELETPAFFRRFNLGINRNKKLEVKIMKQVGRASCLTIMGILGIVATCMGDFELLQKMENENVSSNSTVLHVIQCFFRKSGKWLNETSDGGRLQIWDCYGNANLLQGLKKKMGEFSCLTKENQREMKIVIRKLKRKLKIPSP